MPTLLCYDGSPSARRALEVAARAANGEPAILLHVWTAPERILADSFGASEPDPAPFFPELESILKRRAAEVLAEGETLAGQLGMRTAGRAEISRSSIWQTILDVADEVDASVIVTGTHGTTAVQSDLIGSVSNALVHHAHRPVLVVPAPPS